MNANKCILDTDYVVWLEDQDGGDAGYMVYDNEKELKIDWPYADKIEDRTFVAWVGGWG